MYKQRQAKSDLSRIRREALVLALSLKYSDDTETLQALHKRIRKLQEQEQELMQILNK